MGAIHPLYELIAKGFALAVGESGKVLVSPAAKIRPADRDLIASRKPALLLALELRFLVAVYARESGLIEEPGLLLAELLAQSEEVQREHVEHYRAWCKAARVSLE